MSNSRTDASPVADTAEGAADPAAGSSADRLKARWAEPAGPVPPWWQRVQRRTWVTAGAVAGALLVAGALATVLGPDSPESFRLDPPQTVGQLTREPDGTGQYAQLDRELFPDLPGTTRYREHFVTAYRLPGSAEADFLVAGATGSFAAPVGELDRLLGSVDPVLVPNPAGTPSSSGGYTVFSPGPLGGFLKCVGHQIGQVPTCAWADQGGTTIGAVADHRSGTTTDDLPALAERTRAIREAMTHRVE
ncbi:hypothetical protein ACWGB8_27905 [Kitasatospora sp. NPDC054939]